MSIRTTPLARITVAEAMHTGILMTDPDTPLALVARLMADRHVHAVAISEAGQMRRPLKLVSTLDVAAAVGACEDLTAGEAAQTELRAVPANKPIETAARLMAQNRVEHLLVVDPASGHAEGIISALDVAATLGR